MSKKRKPKQKHRSKEPTMKVIQCIECCKDHHLIALESCQACEFYHKGSCQAVKPTQDIRILSMGSPMRFNRTMFSMSSEALREASLNYYILTDVLNEVRNIDEFPIYRKLKVKLSSGEFKEPQEDKDVNKVESLIPTTCLMREGVFDMLANEHNHDLLFDGYSYKILPPFKEVNGEWEIQYYLYKVYDLDGFGDVEVSGQPYGLAMSPLAHRQADLVLCTQGDKMIIGNVKEKVNV